MDCEQPLAVWHGLGPIAAIGGLGMDWELGHRPGVQAFTWTCVQTSVTMHMHRPAVGMCADSGHGYMCTVPVSVVVRQVRRCNTPNYSYGLHR